MTEPAVASSDATNIRSSIKRDGDYYVINGRKWWTSGAPDKRCKIMIFMGQTDPDNAEKHKRQSMVLVPMDTPGVTVRRNMTVFGYSDREGHCEVDFEGARVPVSNLLGEENGGFAIAQARLGPGRIHHCMRTIGATERALDLLCERAVSRVAFGKTIAEQGVWEHRIADARIAIDQARLYTLYTAWLMDTQGNKAARTEISAIKVAVPRMALEVIDDAIQMFGAAGVSQDTPLAQLYAGIRTLRIADGPDEVHRRTVARRELRKATTRN
jgi:acyl-CoA dehydrogenase